MPFIFKSAGNADGGRVLTHQTIAATTTLTVGDAVRTVAGTLGLVLAGNPVYGIVAGFRKVDGSPVTDNGAGADFTDTYTTAHGNTVMAIVDTSKRSVYTVNATATPGSTTNGNKPGYNFDVHADSDRIDEATPTFGTAQFQSHGVDPSNSARLLVSIQESQVDI